MIEAILADFASLDSAAQATARVRIKDIDAEIDRLQKRWNELRAVGLVGPAIAAPPARPPGPSFTTGGTPDESGGAAAQAAYKANLARVAEEYIAFVQQVARRAIRRTTRTARSATLTFPAGLTQEQQDETLQSVERLLGTARAYFHAIIIKEAIEKAGVMWEMRLAGADIDSLLE